MTRYDGFRTLKILTELTKTEKGYSKFIQRGNLSLYDYNRGFIDLSVHAYLNQLKEPFVRIWFGTVDDGDYGGWLACATLEQAQELVERIANEVFKDMISFPTDEELNRMLRPYGIWVGYE